jgi:hypothetical protein
MIRSGALGPLPRPGGKHVAVAGATLPAVLHARRSLLLGARSPAPHRALARAEPCLHMKRPRDQPPAVDLFFFCWPTVYLAAGSTYDASLLTWSGVAGLEP